ncbi:MAG: alginate lyase family protein [Bdellovibrionaceae bacterium]|nr:alginate lyase family protein [Pseudobdellovibrionaceae bacterium]
MIKHSLFIAILFLISSCAHSSHKRIIAENTSQALMLDWGSLFSEVNKPKNPILQKQIQNVIRHAREDIVQIQTVKNLFSEGIVFSDPKRIATDLAVKNLPSLVYWSVCGRLEADLNNKQKCINQFKSGVLSWVNTYESDGNPINELNLIPVFLSIDIGRDFFSPDEQKSINAWLNKILIMEQNHFVVSKYKSDFKTNHRSWSLAIMSLCAQLLNNSIKLADIKNQWIEHAKINLNDDGSTLDFYMRDALHYHVYNMQAYLWVQRFIPEVIPSDLVHKIENCIQFIKPFYVGEKQHIEFVHTTVQFDNIRRDAGDPSFRNIFWDAKKARNLLLMSRSLYPSVKNWTENVVDENYEAYWKLISNLDKDTFVK